MASVGGEKYEDPYWSVDQGRLSKAKPEIEAIFQAFLVSWKGVNPAEVQSKVLNPSRQLATEEGRRLFFDYVDGQIESSSLPPEAKRDVQRLVLREIEKGNQPGQNALFLKYLYNAYKRGEKPQLEGKGYENVVTSKIVLDSFLRKVFQLDPLPKSEIHQEKALRQLISNFYLYADLMDDTLFQEIHGRILQQIPESNTELLSYLNRADKNLSPQERLLISIFEDPNPEFSSLEQFNKDYHRTQRHVKMDDKPTINNIQKEGMRQEVAAIFKDDTASEIKFLNFFQQAVLTYSDRKFNEYPIPGFYIPQDAAFYLVKKGGKIHFGYYQVRQEKKTEELVAHFLEYTFRVEGETLMGRYEKSLEYFAPLNEVTELKEKAPPHLQEVLP